jgi:terpene synthase-like protein
VPADRMIRLPRFQLPFPDDISPFTELVIGHSCQWARESGLVPDDQAAQRLRRGGIMHAGPRLVPAAPVSAACLVCDWTVFLIVIDDEFDDGRELGARPDLARAAIRYVIDSFRGQGPAPAAGLAHLSGIGMAAADLGRRLAALAPDRDWLARFRRHAEDHLWTKVSEARLRATGTALDVPAYVELRRISGAPYTYSDLVELAGQVVLAEQVVRSSPWALMIEAFADVWLGIQDICSCAKEVAAGDELNLAVVVARTEGLTLQQGIDSTYRWVCQRSEDFALQRAQLIGLAARLRPDGDAQTSLARYLDALDLLIGGHLAWNSQDNPRYTQTISPT